MRSRQMDAGMSGSGASELRSRYLVAGWSFAAVLFAVVGFSAVRFSPLPDLERNAQAYAGLPLPSVAADSVGATGSIVVDDETVKMAILPSAGGMANAEAMRLMEAQVDTLRRELVALRRRSEMLSEQNRMQSDRIAALESSRPGSEESRVPRPAMPQPVDTAAKSQDVTNARDKGQEKANANANVKPDAAKAAANTPAIPAPRPNPVETMPAPETRASAPANATPPVRMVETSRPNPEAMTAEAPRPARPPATPVRVVDLPKAGNDPVSTGSIQPAVRTAPVVTRDLAEAMVIRPADPAGRTLGSSSVIGRSDFAIEIGRYASRSDADAAWTGFQHTHKDRMTDLRALTAPVDGGDNVRLLAGPFANAALAAVACLRLSEDGTSACRPTFFVGEPLDGL